MKNVPIKRLLLAFTLAVPAASWADVYVYQDQDEVVHYTNVRPKGKVKVERVVREAPGALAGSHPPVPTSVVRDIVKHAASAFDVDHDLVHAVIQTESAYDAYAVSAKGARGLMQLMPETATRYGVRNVYDPEQNIWGGVQYLRDLLERFHNDIPLALAAYNAGENAVLRHGGIPPFAETQDYVKRVVKLRQQYRGS